MINDIMKFFLFVFSIAFCSITGAKNIQSDGNLLAKNPADCVTIEKLGNQKTPADIFVGIRKCVLHEKYDTGAKLFLLALAYGKFDSLRVIDKTAHQAIGVLRVEFFSQLEADQIKTIRQRFKTIMDDPSSCKSIISLGVPNYQPDYMLQHGMSAFTGKGKGLHANFNAANAWTTVIKDYLKCSG